MKKLKKFVSLIFMPACALFVHLTWRMRPKQTRYSLSALRPVSMRAFANNYTFICQENEKGFPVNFPIRVNGAGKTLKIPSTSRVILYQVTHPVWGMKTLSINKHHNVQSTWDHFNFFDRSYLFFWRLFSFY